MQKLSITIGLALTASALSLQQAQVGRRATGFALQNGEDAINLKLVGHYFPKAYALMPAFNQPKV